VVVAVTEAAAVAVVDSTEDNYKKMGFSKPFFLLKICACVSHSFFLEYALLF
jgi:hypothetical protein